MARTVMCKNCKFWNQSSTEEDDTGVCDLTHAAWWEPIETDTLAYATDEEGCKVWLVTKADFGCYQGERK